MSLKIEKETAKKLYPDVPKWFQDRLVKEFGEEAFKKHHFTDIKSFNDACDEVSENPDDPKFGERTGTSDELAYKKLKVIAKAINQGWIPDWSNTNQKKWFPWFNLSSGFGFSYSHSDFVNADTCVGSRLCFESEEKAAYAGRQFSDLYKEFLTITN